MKKVLLVCILFTVARNVLAQEKENSNIFIETNLRIEQQVTEKKGGEESHEAKTILGFSTLFAKKRTLAVSASYNYGVEGLWTVGIGYPFWMQYGEEERIIFIPMLYRNFGSFNGTGFGFTVNYEKDRFFILTKHQMALGKNVDYFYNPNMTSGGYRLGKNKNFAIGLEFETIAVTKENPTAIQQDLKVETLLGPMIKFSKPVFKNKKRVIALETSYVFSRKDNRLLLSLVIE